MLSFILAPSGYGKTHNVICEINKILDSSSGKKIFVIVPEQESVKMEAELLVACGNRINADVEVINFSRLANRVFREAGGMTYKYIDNAGKDLMAAVILEKLKSSCPTFSKVADDTKYVRIMRAEMDALRSRGFHANDIEKVREKLIEQDRGGNALSEKLNDFSTVFSVYEKTLKDNAVDTSDDIVRLSETLEEFDFFEDSYVFVDGFYDYTAPQYDVLEKIMKSCLEMTVTLSLQRPDTEEVFRKTTLAFDTLRQRAEKNGIEYKCIELKESVRTKNGALKALANAIMTGSEIKHHDSEGVTVTSVRTPYDECVYVAREIVKLVKRGTAFSEIAICAANIASYAGTLENVLETYGISHLTCSEKSVVQMSIISTVLSALDVINSSFYSKSMSVYLKSNYLGLTEEEGYALENYVSLWGLNKKHWFSEEEWTLHPRGYVEKITESDKKELELVNRARAKVFPSLKLLSEGFRDRSSVREKAETMVKYFDSLELSDKVEKYNGELAEAFGEPEYNDEIGAWNALLTALDMLVEGAGEVNVGRDRFIKYLDLILSEMSFGKIPSSLDEVELGDVEFVRNKNIKHLFFLGFNEGVFPSVGETGSIFTETERHWLIDNGIRIDDTAEDKLKDKTFQFLLAVLRPSETLNFVYHTASSESPKAHSMPSYFYTVIEETLGTAITVADTEKPVSAHELMEYLVAEDRDLSAMFTDEKAASFYKEAATIKEFVTRTQKPFRLDSDIEIVPRDFSLSQSRLERYEKCHFSYFMEYMLNTRVRKKAEFSFSEIGSYVHKILEDVLKNLTANGGDITSVSDDDIEKTARRSAEEYLKTVAPDIMDGSPKYKYLVDNICSFVLLIAENIREEFSVSLFKPRYFEQRIEKGGVVEPYVIKLRDGGTLSFRGIVDRVDTYTSSDGTEYIRVVDYKTKTGGKSFSLEDVLNGMNLQMLIYLFAFTNTKSDTPRAEAGIMYMPASRGEFTPTDIDRDDTVLKAQIDKDLKRSGMYLDDRSIIDAMEIGEDKRFVGLKYDKKEDVYKPNSASTLATLEQFGIIRRYIDKLFDEVINEMKSGNIEAIPIEEENLEGSSCSYCPYKPVCRFDGVPRERIKCEYPFVKMREELGELDENKE